MLNFASSQSSFYYDHNQSIPKLHSTIHQDYINMSQSTSYQSDKQFPLLRLPIELRNMVYSAIDCTPITYRHLGETTLRLEHHPLHNLRRVSRQVKDEYEKEMLLHAKVTIFLDAGNETNTLIFMSVALAYVPLLGRVKHVRVRMDYDSGKRIVLSE